LLPFFGVCLCDINTGGVALPRRRSTRVIYLACIKGVGVNEVAVVVETTVYDSANGAVRGGRDVIGRGAFNRSPSRVGVEAEGDDDHHHSRNH